MIVNTITHTELKDFTTKLNDNGLGPIETKCVSELEDLVEMIKYDISENKSSVPVFISIDNDVYCFESYTKTIINGRECIMLNGYSDNKLIKSK